MLVTLGPLTVSIAAGAALISVVSYRLILLVWPSALAAAARTEQTAADWEKLPV
jgi:hypothetical protein